MIENLVVSLETAKKLKEAGWTKQTECCWAIYLNPDDCNPSYLISPSLAEGAISIQYLANDIEDLEIGVDHPVAFAPTAEEILGELPDKIITKDSFGDRNLHFLFIDKEENGVWDICYGEKVHFKRVSLAEAAAQMWLWLVEKGCIKVKP